MSHLPDSKPLQGREKRTLRQIRRCYESGQKLVMTTAYDLPTARIAEAAGVDMILVGDSVGNVCLGFENTLPVSMAMLSHHLEAVARSRPSAFLIADMPFLSFHLGLEDTIRNAGTFLQQGAQAVKIEAGLHRIPLIRAVIQADIPVMGHLGLMPQGVHAMGGYQVQGRSAKEALLLLEEAQALQEAGCFALLLEGVPAQLAERITETVTIPTIGIGAGAKCSGQVLVFHDVLGLLEAAPPRFVRRYLNGFDQLSQALAQWAADVRLGSFPGDSESYMLPSEAQEAIAGWKTSLRPSSEP